MAKRARPLQGSGTLRRISRHVNEGRTRRPACPRLMPVVAEQARPRVARYDV